MRGVVCVCELAVRAMACDGRAPHQPCDEDRGLELADLLLGLAMHLCALKQLRVRLEHGRGPIVEVLKPALHVCRAR